EARKSRLRLALAWCCFELGIDLNRSFDVEVGLQILILRPRNLKDVDAPAGVKKRQLQCSYLFSQREIVFRGSANDEHLNETGGDRNVASVDAIDVALAPINQGHNQVAFESLDGFFAAPLVLASLDSVLRGEDKTI